MFKVIFFLFLTTIVFCAGVVVGKTSLFRVENVKIYGSTEFNGDEIISLAGIKRGQCVFFIDWTAAQRNLSEKVSAKKVRLYREGSNTVVVEMLKRYASLDIGGGKGIDADGYIMKIDSGEILLRAYTINEYSDSDRQLSGADRFLNGVASVCTRGQSFPFLESVFVCEKGISLMTEDGIAVFIGNTDIILSYRVILTLKETDLWSKKYCYDLSSPGELLIFRRSGLTNNRECHGG
ncbi:hypothetical protein JW890_06175 [candidate division WOR-3 bacterium]|nr:hypothetical protein [candidate division WOR-3 bacterium]